MSGPLCADCGAPATHEDMLRKRLVCKHGERLLGTGEKRALTWRDAGLTPPERQKRQQVTA
jgi:hypothetical protein